MNGSMPCWKRAHPPRAGSQTYDMSYPMPSSHVERLHRLAGERRAALLEVGVLLVAEHRLRWHRRATERPQQRGVRRRGRAEPGRVGSRKYASPALFSSTVTRPVARTSATLSSVPPENATTPPNGRMMFGSIERTERIGPTISGAAELKKRPEARDAALDDLLVDDVGEVESRLRARLGRVLDLHAERRAASAPRLQDPAGRSAERAATGLVVVVVLASVVVVSDAPPPLAAGRGSEPGDRDERDRRERARSTRSHGFQDLDALLERRVRVEEAVEPRALLALVSGRAATRSRAAPSRASCGARPPCRSAAS